VKKASLKLQHVGHQVYHAISESNRSLEEFVEGLEQLMSFDVLPAKKLRAYQVMAEEVRALVNQDLAEVISDRECHNSAYYEHLRLGWQGQLREVKPVSRGQRKRSQRQEQRKAVQK
jgi:hypothetical protein